MTPLRKHLALSLLLLSQSFGESLPLSGLVGGFNGPSGYAASITPDGTVTSLPVALPTGEIIAVAVNNANIGLLGGSSSTQIYAAFVLANQTLQPLNVTGLGQVFSVALNDSNLGLLGGHVGAFPANAYAAFVTLGNATPAPLNVPTQTTINSVALNESNLGLIGGHQVIANTAYAAFVTPNGAAPQIISSTATEILSVDLNDLGLGLIGGQQNSSAYAAFVSGGSAISYPIDLSASQADVIENVSINNSGVGLIAGSGPSAVYAAFVKPGTAPQVISGLPVNGLILSTAINQSNRGIIGGDDGNNGAYAALVSLGDTLQPLVGLPQGQIEDVVINDLNQGLIVGTINPSSPYAAIVSPSGLLTPLKIGFSDGTLSTAAINAFFLSELPTQGLKGNNLRFANYLNANAPEDVFYFVPSILEDTFAQALESAAPTRNAISFNTTLQNAFYLTTALSTHLHDQRAILSRAKMKGDRSTAFLEGQTTEEELLASRCLQKKKTSLEEKPCLGQPKPEEMPPKNLPTCTIWLEAVGALASQEAQHETPEFSPKAGGGILAFDGKVCDTMTVGGGATYLYTKVHEGDSAGSSHINQEDLFAYFSWEPKHFYIDAAVWGGLFQTHQTRHIHMPGFAFDATSKPKGWQVVPHLELGFLANIVDKPSKNVTWNLLVMGDWANTWQDKYKERGSGPFNFKQKSHYGSLLRTEASVRFTETLMFSTWNLIFQEKGGYVNVQSFHAGKLNTFLIGSPGTLTLETLTGSQNLGVVQMLVTAASFKGGYPSATLFYQGEFGSGYSSNQLGLEFAIRF